MTEWATANGRAVTAAATEEGSALNGLRRSIQRLLADGHVSALAVEHRHRLATGGWRI